MTPTFMPKFHLSDPFSPAEYRDRIARFHRELRRRELDGMLLFAVESHVYLYNYDQIGAWFFQVLVVPADGEPVALVRHADQWLVQQSPFIKEVRTWRDTDADPTLKLGDILRDLGLSNRRIGIEMTTQFLNAATYEAVKSQVTACGCTLVDASAVVGELRLIKSPAEIDCLRTAGRILDASYAAAFETIRPGVRECDVYAAALQAMYAAGGSQSAAPMSISSGINTLTFSHYTPTRRVIQASEPVFIEAGGCFNHYHAVGVQTVCAGKPDDTMRRLYDQVQTTLRAARPLLAPGVRAADVARGMAATLDDSARANWGIHFGYGTGIGSAMVWFDRLRISETSTYELQPGMTFFLFSGRMLDERYFLLLGDPIVITERGFELLSSTASDQLRSLG